jgi:hypothetical protein
MIIFSMEKEMKIINWEQDFFVHHRIVSAVKRLEFCYQWGVIYSSEKSMVEYQYSECACTK